MHRCTIDDIDRDEAVPLLPGILYLVVSLENFRETTISYKSEIEHCTNNDAQTRFSNNNIWKIHYWGLTSRTDSQSKMFASKSWIFSKLFCNLANCNIFFCYIHFKWVISLVVENLSKWSMSRASKNLRRICSSFL